MRPLTQGLPSEHCVLIDEMGSPRGLTRLYGRAAPGQRVLDHVPGDRGGHGSTVGARGLEGLRTGVSVPGASDGQTLRFFGADLRGPTRKRGDIVGMDNNPIPKLDDIEDALDAAGAGVRFLPTSSPDLNPLELCWSNVNSPLRSLTPRTFPDLLDAFGHAFSSLPRHDILHWFQHCGYQVAAT